VVPCPRFPRRLRCGRGCRPRGWGCHRLARGAFLPVMHLRMSEHDTSGMRPLTRRWRRHRTRFRSPVTRCRLPVSVASPGPFQKSLSIMGELVECPQLTDSPHLFIRRELFPRSRRVYASLESKTRPQNYNFSVILLKPSLRYD